MTKVKNNIIGIILTMVVAVVAVSCRVNNGDIGDYYGTWWLTEMSVDGVVDTSVNEATTTWSFQNNVINIKRLRAHADYDTRFGTWEESDDELLLNFTHHDDATQAGQGGYAAPTWLYMEQNAILHLKFVSRSGSKMVLKYVDTDGREIVYNLKKEY